MCALFRLSVGGFRWADRRQGRCGLLGVAAIALASSSVLSQEPVHLVRLVPPCPEYVGGFASAVAADYTGSVIAVGAPSGSGGMQYGTVMVFDRSGSEWLLDATLSSRMDRDEFGAGVVVSADGTRLMAYAPQTDYLGGEARIYHRIGMGWVHRGSHGPLGNIFNGAHPRIAVMNAGGDTVMSPNATWGTDNYDTNGPGAVFLACGPIASQDYWSGVATPIRGLDGEGWRQFGSQVGISGDGQIAVIAFQHPSLGYCAAVYARQADQWLVQSGPYQTIAGPTAVSDDGSVFAFGSQVFEKDAASGTYAVHTAPVPAGWNGSSFGHSIAMSAAGDRMLLGGLRRVVGGVEKSGVAVYTRQSGGGWAHSVALQEPNEDSGFGSAVALSGDGEIAVVGALSSTVGGIPSVGAVHVFALDAPIAITQQPAEASVIRGRRATFGVGVSSRLPVTYQWRRNGLPLADGPLPTGAVASGAATGTLTIFGTTLEDDGAAFDCIATNAQGSVTSSIADLFVRLAPAECIGDVNDDGGIDGADVEFFFAHWENGC